MIIAQISDLHVSAERGTACGGADTVAALEAAVRHLNAIEPRPDVVVATGDLVDHGTVEEYVLLEALLRPLRAPVFLIPGNHDDRAALRTVFGGAAYLRGCRDWIQYTIDEWPVRLVALDTTVPGASHGALCPERIAWLVDRFAERPWQPTVVLMHHPPFATGIAALDEVGLRSGGAELAAVIARAGHVERILCGHVHRVIQARWHGTMASVAPSTARQIALDLRAETRAGYVAEPPACHLHVWRQGEGLVSHLSFVGDGEPGRPPRRPDAMA